MVRLLLGGGECGSPKQLRGRDIARRQQPVGLGQSPHAKADDLQRPLSIQHAAGRLQRLMQHTPIMGMGQPGRGFGQHSQHGLDRQRPL